MQSPFCKPHGTQMEHSAVGTCYCFHLKEYNGPGGDVVIPEQETEIRGWAIHGPAGSWAEAYAKENDIPFGPL